MKINTLFCLSIFIFACTILCVTCAVISTVHMGEIEDRLKNCPLPSICDIQERVGVKVDGRVGPKTIKAWDDAYIEQSASKAMERAMNGTNKTSKKK